jgi:hypothetical protein
MLPDNIHELFLAPPYINQTTVESFQSVGIYLINPDLIPMLDHSRSLSVMNDSEGSDETSTSRSVSIQSPDDPEGSASPQDETRLGGGKRRCEDEQGNS